MGMFDSIQCKYKLPLPKKLMELKGFDFSNHTFQTKSLEDSLSYFEIRKDGKLYEEVCEYKWVEGDPKAKSVMSRIGHRKTVSSNFVFRKNFTGVINFYDSIQDGDSAKELKNDYWIEFSALVKNGKITEIKLVKFEASDNTERREQEIKHMKKMQQRNNLWNRWYMKYLYFYYDKAVRKIFFHYRNLSQKLPTNYKVESWLRPL